MQLLKDPVLCQAWFYTRACVFKAKQMLPLGIIYFTVIEDKGHSYLRDTYFRGLLCLWDCKRNVNAIWSLSTPPCLSPKQGLGEQGSVPDIREKQLLQAASVVSCKQPCGVMPHLPQELALLWEGGTETSEWRKGRDGWFWQDLVLQKRKAALIDPSHCEHHSGSKRNRRIKSILNCKFSFLEVKQSERTLSYRKKQYCNNQRTILFHLSLLPQALKWRKGTSLRCQFQHCWRHFQSACL